MFRPTIGVCFPTRIYYILIRSNKMQQYAGIYLLQNYSTCFGCPSHPSSGVHKTVTAASGTGHSTWATTFLQRGHKATLEEGCCCLWGLICHFTSNVIQEKMACLIRAIKTANVTWHVNFLYCLQYFIKYLTHISKTSLISSEFAILQFQNVGMKKTS